MAGLYNHHHHLFQTVRACQILAITVLRSRKDLGWRFPLCSCLLFTNLESEKELRVGKLRLPFLPRWNIL